MTIIAAAINQGKVSISSDTQSNFGSIKVDADHMLNSVKLYEVNGSVIGLCGWTAVSLVVEHLIKNSPESFKLNSCLEIFETLIQLQETLKSKYFIETHEDSDQPVESNQIDGLVINENGIFSFGSYREVSQYPKFWAIGSGKRFALGAMHAEYGHNGTAQSIAEAGVKAAATFDDGSSLPLNSRTLTLKT